MHALQCCGHKYCRLFPFLSGGSVLPSTQDPGRTTQKTKMNKNGFRTGTYERAHRGLVPQGRTTVFWVAYFCVFVFCARLGATAGTRILVPTRGSTHVLGASGGVARGPAVVARAVRGGAAGWRGAARRFPAAAGPAGGR